MTRLKVAVARGDEALLRDVILRFPETKAGDEALYRLAHFLWDHGRARAAARSVSDSVVAGVAMLVWVAAANWSSDMPSDTARNSMTAAPYSTFTAPSSVMSPARHCSVSGGSAALRASRPRAC